VSVSVKDKKKKKTQDPKTLEEYAK